MSKTKKYIQKQNKYKRKKSSKFKSGKTNAKSKKKTTTRYDSKNLTLTNLNKRILKLEKEHELIMNNNKMILKLISIMAMKQILQKNKLQSQQIPFTSSSLHPNPFFNSQLSVNQAPPQLQNESVLEIVGIPSKIDQNQIGISKILPQKSLKSDPQSSIRNYKIRNK